MLVYSLTLAHLGAELYTLLETQFERTAEACRILY